MSPLQKAEEMYHVNSCLVNSCNFPDPASNSRGRAILFWKSIKQTIFENLTNKWFIRELYKIPNGEVFLVTINMGNG
jgi:hypothetical protein